MIFYYIVKINNNNNTHVNHDQKNYCKIKTIGTLN